MVEIICVFWNKRSLSIDFSNVGIFAGEMEKSG
jgi:hypothetical protein